jgi:hypothetical protein
MPFSFSRLWGLGNRGETPLGKNAPTRTPCKQCFSRYELVAAMIG